MVAYLLGLQLGADFKLWNLLGVFAALFLVSLGFSSLFIMIAIRSTRWETHMAIMNLMNLPLLFTSNSLFPTQYMPEWLQIITKINPITYTTDAVRQLTLFATDMQQLTLDFTFLGIFAVLFTSIGILLSWRYLSK
jgi:ABC-2 type transport system permease protein